jgi:hypothetical protein
MIDGVLTNRASEGEGSFVIFDFQKDLIRIVVTEPVEGGRGLVASFLGTDPVFSSPTEQVVSRSTRPADTWTRVAR